MPPRLYYSNCIFSGLTRSLAEDVPIFQPSDLTHQHSQALSTLQYGPSFRRIYFLGKPAEQNVYEYP